MDYKEIRRICERSSDISRTVVDDFLMGYAAAHRGLEKKMEKHFASYKHVLSKFEKSNVNLFKAQWIVHRIFREDGLLARLLRNPALDRFQGEEKDFLLQQLEVPWRYSFSVIMDEPAPDFFLMRDIFSEEEYLLFSPGITQEIQSGGARLWSNLIGFNGSCWQSFGPIGAYKSFDAGDVFFYATELDYDIEEPVDVFAHIQMDPLPYMLLISGAAFPPTVHGEDEILHVMAEYDLDSLDSEPLKNSFRSEYDGEVFRFTHKELGEHPHFAQAYFDENLKLLLFSALTERGFGEVVKAFHRAGHDYPEEPVLRVHLQMLTTAGDILRRKMEINEYEHLFQEKEDPVRQKAVDDLNAFMELVLPDINAGRKPDIEAAARKTGVHPDTAREMVQMVMGKLDQMPGKPPVPPKEKKELLALNKLYYHARRILVTEPWKDLQETDVFGIRIPGTDKIYFISVMGANGEYRALAAYKGYEGLVRFYDFVENADRRQPETILTIPHLMLSFTDREMMDEDNMAAVRKVGEGFRGKGRWPRFEDIEPAYMPVFPEGKALEDMAVIVQQAADFLIRKMDNPASLAGSLGDVESILVCTPEKHGKKIHWVDRFETMDPEKGRWEYRIELDREAVAGVSRLQVEPVTLQMEHFLLPAPIKEEGKRGYFPFIMLMVDKRLGQVVHTIMLKPEPDMHSMYESMPNRVLDELASLGYRPERIEVRSDLLFGLLEKHLKEAWVRVEQVEHMPYVDEAAASLLERFSK